MGRFKKIDELDKEIAKWVIESGRLYEEILSLRREGYPDYHKNLKTRLHNYYKANGEIKKLEKEKTELMNKYLQDSMKMLELMGIVSDSNTYLGRNVWVRTSNGEQIKGKVLREEGERVYVVNPHNGQTAWRFKREVEFVKDNDATENGSLEGNIGSNKEIESMPLEKDTVQAQDSKFKVLYYTGEDIPNSKLKAEVLSAENSEKVKEILKKKDPNIWRWVEIRQVQDNRGSRGF